MTRRVLVNSAEIDMMSVTMSLKENRLKKRKNKHHISDSETMSATRNNKQWRIDRAPIRNRESLHLIPGTVLYVVLSIAQTNKQTAREGTGNMWNAILNGKQKQWAIVNVQHERASTISALCIERNRST